MVNRAPDSCRCTSLDSNLNYLRENVDFVFGAWLKCIGEGKMNISRSMKKISCLLNMFMKEHPPLWASSSMKQ